MSRCLVLLGLFTSWMLTCDASHGQVIKKQVPAGTAERPDESTLPVGRDAALPPGAILRLGNATLRHPSALTALIWSANGKQLISSGDDGARFWSVERGVLVHAWPEARASVLAASPDSRLVAAGGADGWIRLWDVRQANPGTPIKVAAQGNVKVLSLAFSPDGKLLACTTEARDFGDSDAAVRLFDVATGNERRQFKDIANGGHALAFSPDGKLLAGAEGSRGSVRGGTDIRIWNISSGDIVHRLPGHTSWVRRLSFSRDGKGLVSSCTHETRQWLMHEQRAVHVWTKATQGRFVADDKQIMVLRGPTVELRDAGTGNVVVQSKVLYGPDADALIAAAPDGETLASADRHGLIRLWNAATGKERVLYAGHRGTIEGAAWSPDGSVILTGGSDSTLRLWGAATGLQLRLIELPPNSSQWGKNTAGLGFSANGRVMFAGQADGAIRLWSTATGKLIHKLAGHHNWITSAAAAPGGPLLATAGWDGTLRLWDVDQAAMRRFLIGQDEPRGDTSIAALAFAPDGKHLVSASEARFGRNRAKPKTLQLWDVATGQLLREFGPVGERVLPRHIVWNTPRELYAESKQIVQLWDPQTGALVHEYPARHKHWGEIPAFAVSRDGTLLTLADNEGIHLWDTLMRQKLHTIAPQGQAAERLAFSPDGKQLLVGYAGGALLIWDLAALALPPAPKGALPPDRRPNEAQAEEFKRWWDALGRHDAAESRGALWRFVHAGPNAVDWLVNHVPPPLPRDLQQIPVLIKDLHDADDEARAKALAKLAEFGASAAPALHEALRAPLPVPVRRRVELALAFLHEHPVHPEELRRLRAIEILERLGTPAAEHTLERWGKGDSRAPTTGVALAAWQRVHALRRLAPTRVLNNAEIAQQERPMIGSRPASNLIRLKGPVTALAFAPDGTRLVCGSTRSPLSVVDVASGRLIRTFDDFPAVALAAARSRFAAASARGQLLMGSFDDDSDVYIKERGAIACVALSPDEAVLAAGTEDGLLGFWSADGKKLRAAKTPLKKVTSVAFLPDGKTLLVGGIVDETADFNGRLHFTQPAPISLWNVAEAKEIRRFGVRGSSVALHPDGRTVVGGGLARFFAKNWRGGGFITIDDITFTQGNKITWWDLQRDREIQTMDAKGSRPHFGRSGELMLAWGEDVHQQTSISWGTNEMGGSMSNDSNLYVLDAATASFVPLGAEIRCAVAALAGDGRTLAWGSADGTVTVWDLRPAGPPTEAAVDIWWDDLGNLGDGRAWQALWNLAGFPDETLAWLRRKLRPVPVSVGARLEALLADLDSPMFARRDQATAELKKLGNVAEHALRQARGKAANPETSRRLDAILHALAMPQAEDIRAARALHLLRHLAIPAARELLREVSLGYPHARLTQEAQRLLR